MARHFALATSFVLIVCLSQATGRLTVLTDAAAQSASAAGTSQPAREPSRPGGQDMMKMHEQMMAQMKEGDVKLDALVKEMNAASGDAKVNAVAAVVAELVRQHKAMHEHMGHMHQHMTSERGMMMKR